jgi:hypothetical protein
MAIVFQNATESVRTATTDPYTFTHTPAAGTPRAVVLTIVNGSSTPLTASVTYGGVAMQSIVSATDTATETGRANIWFLGSGIPTGAQTVEIDLTSAASDDVQYTCMTFTAATDTEVVDFDSINEDATNPSVTLQYGGRSSIAIGALYSGLAAPSNISQVANTTLVSDHDFGNFSAEVARQTNAGTADFTMGFTAANDDVAFVAIAIAEALPVTVGRAFAQSQARIKLIRSGLGQTQARIKQIYPQFAQAQARVYDPSAPYASDTYTRTRASDQGFGTADIGGDYTHSSSALLTGVDGSAAFYTNTGSTSKVAYLADVIARDIDMSYRWKVANLPGAAENYLVGSLGRLQDISNYYRLDVRLNQDGTTDWIMREVVGGSASTIGSITSTGVTLTANQWIRVRIQLEGINPTTIRAKAWLDGNSEPGTWSFTDSTNSAAALQTAGAVGYRLLPSAATYTTTVSIDDLLVTAIAPPGVTYYTHAQALATIRGLTEARDSFTRTETGDWGDADVGGTWAHQNDTNVSGDATFDVDGSAGTITGHLVIAPSALSWLPDVAIGNLDYQVRFKLSDLFEIGHETILRFVLRTPNTRYTFSDSYNIYTSLDGGNNGGAYVLYRGAINTVGSYFTGAAIDTPNTWYWVRAQLTSVGNVISVRSKVWLDGTTEPDWQGYASETAPGTLFAPGSAGVMVEDIHDGQIVSYDNFKLVTYIPMGTGQAQAIIKQTANAFGQANAWIKVTNIEAVGQANAWIKTTNIEGVGQAGARVNAGGILYYLKDTFSRSGFVLGQPDIGGYTGYTAPDSGLVSLDGSKLNAAIGGGIYDYTLQANFVLPHPYVEYSIDFNTTWTDTEDAQIKIQGALGAFANYYQGTVELNVGDPYNDTFSIVAGETYTLKLRESASSASIKIWKTSDPEPEWLYDVPNFGGFPTAPYLVIRIIEEDAAEPTGQLWVDNFFVTEIVNAKSGQAQARIKQVYSAVGQANAYIEILGNAFGQAQAQITEFDIEAFGQAQGLIKQTYNAFGQAQANIKSTYNGFGQANSAIKQTYNQVAQAQARIKQSYQAYAQAEARIILGVFRGRGQVAGAITHGVFEALDDFSTAGSLNGTEADIGGTWIADAAFSSNGSVVTYAGTTSAVVKAVVDEATLRGIAEVSADIALTVDGPSGTVASAGIFALLENQGTGIRGYGVTLNFNITNGQYGFTLNLGNNGSSSPTLGNYILGNTYRVKVQVNYAQQGVGINKTIRAKVWDITAGDPEPGWQHRLSATGNVVYGPPGFTSNNNGILAIRLTVDNFSAKEIGWTESGQAQARIVQTVHQFAQSQAQIKQTYFGLGQAQAHITAININAHGQAAAEIFSFLGLKSYGQAQALIQTTAYALAQAQAKIIDVTFDFYAQAGARIKGDGALVYLKDTFTRVTINSPDIGPDYIINSSDYSIVDGNKLVLKTDPAEGYASINIENPLDISNFDASIEFRIPTPITEIDYWYLQLSGQALFSYFQIEQSGGTGTEAEISVGGPSTSVWDDFTLEYDVTYIIRLRAWGIATFGKIWKKSDPEPDWALSVIDEFFTGETYGGEAILRAEIYPANVGDEEELWIDNYNITEVLNTSSGQGQALIEVAASVGYGQSQALIVRTENAHGQAQGHITRVEYGHGQAQAALVGNASGQAQGSILAVYMAFGQAQSSIKAIYDGYGQAQAKINAFDITALGQAQGNIKGVDLESVGQAQAQIKGIDVNAYGQAQANILAVSNVYAQAQARILQTYLGFGQAQAAVVGNASGQAEALIKATYFGFGQAMATIRGNAFAQAQGYVKTVNVNAHGQAQAQILTSYLQHAQAQAYIKRVDQTEFGQAQAQIKQTYVQHAQAQADILATYVVIAQAQALIKQVYFAFAQAQARVLTNYAQHGQAQANILATYISVAQAQANIKATYQNVAQAQGTILAVSISFGQAQANVKTSYQGHGQAEAYMLAFGQNAFAQAQANIKFTGTAGSGQAQAKINAFDQNVFGQSQGSIKTVYSAFGQAQGTIKAVSYGLGQAQAAIKQTYTAVAQAQAQIKQTYVGHGQANAYVKVTDIEAFAQARAWIEITSSAHGQSQAYIKIVQFGLGQAQGYIQTAGLASGNTQAQIKQVYNVFGQANALIRRTETASGQAAALIVTRAQGYGQAQAAIRVVVVGQAQAQIKATYNAHANAQALIRTNVIVVGQSQAQIKAVNRASGNAQALITSGTIGVGQAQALIQTTASGSGQSQAFILKSAGYAQAQGFIYQPHTLKSLDSRDRDTLELGLINREIPALVIEDKKAGKLEVSDRASISLDLTDRGE